MIVQTQYGQKSIIQKNNTSSRTNNIILKVQPSKHDYETIQLLHIKDKWHITHKNTVKDKHWETTQSRQTVHINKPDTVKTTQSRQTNIATKQHRADKESDLVATQTNKHHCVKQCSSIKTKLK